MAKRLGLGACHSIGRGGVSGIIFVRCGDTFAATNPLFKTGLVTLSINPAHIPGLKAGESNGFNF